MKDELSSTIAALTADVQRVRADTTIDTVTKRELISVLQAKIAALTEQRRQQHALRTNKVSALERRLREW